MICRFVLLSAVAISLFGQGEISAPRVGLWRDGQGIVRSLDGVAASFVPGAVLCREARQLEWFGDLGWVRFDRRLELMDPAGNVLAFEELDDERVVLAAGEALLADRELLLKWDGATLTRERVNVDEWQAKQAERREARIDWHDGYLLVARPSGDEVRFAMPNRPDTIERMSADWMHLRAGSRSHALRVVPGRESLFEIPAGEALAERWGRGPRNATR